MRACAFVVRVLLPSGACPFQSMAAAAVESPMRIRTSGVESLQTSRNEADAVSKLYRVACLYHVAGAQSSSQTTTGLALPRTAARRAWKLAQVDGLPAAVKQSSLMAVVALCCFAISRSLLATLTVSPVAVMCWWAEGPSLEITTGP
jgi:hypothetical protein